jgi:hypothetical protein
LKETNWKPKGVLNMDLTVGNKTILTKFFIINGKGSYSLLHGRDCIHTKCCILSTIHHVLLNWIGDQVEILSADIIVNMTTTNLDL